MLVKHYGPTHVNSRGFRNLRKRLTAVGFVVSVGRDTGTVTLAFPELENSQWNR